MKHTVKLAGLIIALCVVMGTACRTGQPEPVTISPELRRALGNISNMVGPVETPDDKRFEECYDSCFESCTIGETNINKMDEVNLECEKYCRDDCKQRIKTNPEAYK